ncbi:catalase-like domain-containing protein [Aspergillus insuetus]
MLKVVNSVVHAKTSGSYGTFEATHDCSDFTSASFLNMAGKKTPVLLRVSTVGPEAGSADTSRDVHGWAMKFYTDEGNLDWVFNNTPVCFIRDPIKFPSMNRSHKRHPQTHLPDANMFWDFHVGNPEGIHQLLVLFSDRGTPQSVRHLNAYSGHTYKFTKPKKYQIRLMSTTVRSNTQKFTSKLSKGVKNFSTEEATRIAGEDPDFMIRDMFEAIERGDYPVWNVYIQLMSPEEAEKYQWNIFDMTKVWPHRDFPLQQIGRLTMNRNPRNYFTDIEQAAFSPSTMVPGFAPSADPNAARYRLGVNYQQLPTNAAKTLTYCPFQRDGQMRFDDNYGGDPNYVGSSLKPTKFYQDMKCTNPSTLALHTEHEKWAGEVSAYTSEIKDEDFVQPAALWEVIGREPGHQNRVIANLVTSVKGVKYPELRKAVYNLFSRVNNDLGLKLQECTEAAINAV